ncbi:MAG: hypothetical protein WDO24_08045 [Pseudomonadota bacterium]
MTGIGPQDLEGRVEHLAHDFDASDQQAERDRDHGGEREAAIDPTHRLEQVDVERAR